MKPWDGRFKDKTLPLLDKFNASIYFDKELYKEDIEGSIAHCKMLVKQGIISEEDGDKIINGLSQILKEIENGEFQFKVELEDIHMNIEARLIELIGEIGGKLHTARSRNDQVATDVKLYLKKKIVEIREKLLQLLKVLVKKAEENLDVILPGFTHLQIAQPILLSHYFMAYFEMFKRDYKRLNDCLSRMDECPLGSGALAGTTFNIDRFYTSELLGFKKPTDNSLDSVSDRDFIVEFISASAIIMAHLSRISEEIILWNSQMFNFLDLPDSMCTGSSIMPQKKNPDVPELVRGKTGRVYGNLMNILTVLKGLPLAYNKDLQEDKEPLFDTVKTVLDCIEIMTEFINKIKPNKEIMKYWADKGFSTATDIADYLVNKGIPFRNAHKITGSIVKYCIENNKSLDELSIEEFKNFSEKFDEDIFEFISLKNVINRRNSYGGTSIQQVVFQINEAKKFLTPK